MMKFNTRRRHDWKGRYIATSVLAAAAASIPKLMAPNTKYIKRYATKAAPSEVNIILPIDAAITLAADETSPITAILLTELASKFHTARRDSSPKPRSADMAMVQTMAGVSVMSWFGS